MFIREFCRKSDPFPKTFRITSMAGADGRGGVLPPLVLSTPSASPVAPATTAGAFFWGTINGITQNMMENDR